LSETVWLSEGLADSKAQTVLLLYD